MPLDQDVRMSDRSAADRWIAFLCLVLNIVAWTAVPAQIFPAPHPNALELALWGREWYVVNYEHPALAAWLLGLAYSVTGIHLWVPFFVAELCIAGAYVFVYLLGRDLLGARWGMFGTLLLPVVSHYTLDALRLNQNVVQLPFWVAFCFGLWRASRSDRPHWWVFAAAMAALGVYAKLSMAMVVAFGALWLLIDPEARGRLRGRAPYFGLLVFVVLLIPLVAALVESRFLAITWIGQESGARGTSGPHFLRSVSRTLLYMALAAGGGMLATRIGSRRDASRPSSPPPIEPRAFSYLLFMGAGPLLLTMTIAVVKPIRLEWASPMYSMIGLVLVALVIRFLPRQAGWARAGGRHVVLWLIGSLAILAAYVAGDLRDRGQGRITKEDWPAVEIAARFDTIWRDHTGGAPLRIFGGDTWTAGIAALFSADRPSFFSQLNPEMSLGITPERVQQQGMLVLWSPGSTWQIDPALVARYPHGTEAFAVPDAPKVAPITIYYVVVAPGQWQR
jgi:4-amino-4-deoxy-L-arabinose transferase-like glycosyltransferase